MSLAPGIRGTPVAGQVRHPEPLSVPADFEPIGDAADLYFRSESAWGGQRLLSTESIGVVVLNTGYSLREATFRVRGEDADGKQLFSVEQATEELPRGEEIKLEIASYEIPSGPERLSVALVSAEFSPVK
ncbi:unnamed protein product [marine sediment metagenome]|uniref:Uncharacterized protein n=1 Tax=marine sediment metagenome TaxID=412755 RepID=X0VAM1_9ZZZZ